MSGKARQCLGFKTGTAIEIGNLNAPSRGIAPLQNI